MTEPPPPTRPDSLSPAGDVRLLLSTAPPGKAHQMARTLVEEGLAACVNVLPGARSVYRWQGQLLDEPETVLLIKTVPSRLDALGRRLCEVHPYDVPELLTLEPASGLAPYLAWVRTQTEVPDGDPRGD